MTLTDAEIAAVTALSGGPLSVVAVDDGRIRVATDLAARRLGHPAATLVGRRLADLAAPDDRSSLDPLLGGEATGGIQIGVITADGAPRSIRLDGGPSIISVELARPAVYWESDAAEPALSANPLRGVDGALSHDVRGALRGVKSFLELVERSDALAADEKASRFLGIARAAGADADVMVERLVHLLRIHDRPVEIEALAVADLLAEASERTADTEGVPALTVAVEGELPHVVGNRELLVECLTELLTNAARFGGDDTTVTVSSTDREGWAWIRVADDGPGVPEDLLDDAFRFFRLLQPKGRYPGVGMGLPICRATAEAHAGRLHLELGPDGGTVAVLRLVVTAPTGKVRS